MTALLWASLQGHLVVVELLLDQGADPMRPETRSKCTPLHLAALHGHVDVMECLLRQPSVHPSTPDRIGRPPLAYASQCCEARPLSKGAVDLNSAVSVLQGNTLLACAQGGHPNAVEYLLAHGANAKLQHYTGGTSLHRAATPEVARILLAHGALIDASREEGHATVLQQGLLDVNLLHCGYLMGRTPLNEACARGDFPIASFLLSQGASLKITELHTEYTILHLAVLGGSIDVLELVIAHLQMEASALDVVDSFGCSPLYYAVATSSLPATVALVRGGANINARTTDGSVPLHGAVEQGSLDVADFLLANDADPNIPLSTSGEVSLDPGATSLDLARVEGNTAMAELLLRYGAHNGTTPSYDSPINQTRRQRRSSGTQSVSTVTTATDDTTTPSSGTEVVRIKHPRHVSAEMKTVKSRSTTTR